MKGEAKCTVRREAQNKTIENDISLVLAGEEVVAGGWKGKTIEYGIQFHIGQILISYFRDDSVVYTSEAK